jgi:hypothetical protein
MKIRLGGFKAKLEKEDIFKPTPGNEILYEDNNENVVGVVNLATLKFLLLKARCLFTEIFIKTPVPF